MVQTGPHDVGPWWKVAPGTGSSRIVELGCLMAFVLLMKLNEWSYSAKGNEKLLSLVGLMIRNVYILCAS